MTTSVMFSIAVSALQGLFPSHYVAASVATVIERICHIHVLFEFAGFQRERFRNPFFPTSLPERPRDVGELTGPRRVWRARSGRNMTRAGRLVSVKPFGRTRVRPGRYPSPGEFWRTASPTLPSLDAKTGLLTGIQV